MEAYERGWPGRGKTVLLDDYFNHEIRKSKITVRDEVWHYKWDERPDAGFYAWGQIFKSLGCPARERFRSRRTREHFAGADVYIIVDPDTAKETANPNYVEPHT